MSLRTFFESRVLHSVNFSRDTKQTLGPQPELRQTQALNALARTAFVAPVSALFTPTERAMRKLVGEQQKGNKTTFRHCFSQVLQNHPMKGYLSKTCSNFFKSGALFGIQSLVGGYAGFAWGGVFQGMGTSCQQVLDHQLAKHKTATNYWQLLQQMPVKTLVKNFKNPCVIGGVQGGFFWGLFTYSTAKKEQKMKNYLSQEGINDKTLEKAASLFIRFESAVEVGFVTYPTYRLIQVLVRHPEVSVSQAIFCNAKPNTIKEAASYAGTALRRAYSSVLPGLLLFGTTRAVVLTAAGVADTVVACVKDRESTECKAKR